MREAVLKDWIKVPASQRNELKGYVMTKVLQGTCAGVMPPYVRSKLLQVFAIIIKRGLFDDVSANVLGELIAYVQTLISDQQTRALGMFITHAVLQEFSSNTCRCVVNVYVVNVYVVNVYIYIYMYTFTYMNALT
jgi:hypothetical protein